MVVLQWMDDQKLYMTVPYGTVKRCSSCREKLREMTEDIGEVLWEGM